MNTSIVSISEANQNFSRVARMTDKHGELYIFKNNKPKYKLVDIEQGMPVAIPGSNEGDVNATVICTTGIISNLAACLELPGYPPIFYGAEKIEFSSIIQNLLNESRR